MTSGITLVVPAAGRGLRMRAVDPRRPKELLPVRGKPAIQYAIDEGLDIGADKIIVVLSSDKPELEAFLKRLEASIEFVYQPYPAGEADAVACAEARAGSGPVAVVYPDNLFLPSPGALRCLHAVYQQHCLDVVALTPVTQANVWATANAGKVRLNRLGMGVFAVRELLPKAAGRFTLTRAEELRACGIALHGAHLFDTIRAVPRPPAGEEFTDRPVRELIRRQRGLLGARVPGVVHDLGDPLGYRYCTSQSTEVSQSQ